MLNFFNNNILPKAKKLDQLVGTIHVPVKYKEEAWIVPVRVK